MSKKLKKWEIEYENYSNGHYDARFVDLAQKVDDKACNKEEFKEFKKLEAIKANLYKVKNIMELRDKLYDQKKEIDEELKRRKETKDLNKEKEELEKENADLMLEDEEIKSKLKNKDLSDKERADLENKREQNIKKRQENNSKFITNQENMKLHITEKETPLMQKTDEELEENKIAIGTKISKCNMVCSNLMQGKSWKTIELKLDQWEERYTGKKGEAKKMKQAIENTENEPEQTKEGSPKESTKVDGKKIEEPSHKEETLPVEYKSFAERHPRLAKIPFLAKIMDKIQNKTNQNKSEINIENQLKETSAEIGKNVQDILKEQENQKENPKENPKDDFKNYLKEVAEKGLDGIEQEKKEKAKERLAAMKERAQDPNRYKIDANGIKHDTFAQNVEDNEPEK